MLSPSFAATGTQRCSHRLGESEDPFIAHLAVATGAGSGSRTDCVGKYNRCCVSENNWAPEAEIIRITQQPLPPLGRH